MIHSSFDRKFILFVVVTLCCIYVCFAQNVVGTNLGKILILSCGIKKKLKLKICLKNYHICVVVYVPRFVLVFYDFESNKLRKHYL